MSAAIIKAGRLEPEIRLGQALSEFQVTLTKSQKASFRAYQDKARTSPPDIRDVMQLTAEINRSTENGRCYGPRLTNVLQAVQQFAALGDIIVGGSQNILACGVWSLVRMTLLGAIKYSSYFERLSLMLMAAGRSAPRFQAIALIYPKSRSLQSSMTEYFIVVVKLCQHVLNLTKKSGFGQWISSFNDSKLDAFQVDLELWANSVKEEVIPQIAQQLSEETSENLRARTQLFKRFDNQSHAKKLKMKQRLLDSCSTYDYETAWKQTRKLGNTSLLKESTVYQAWKDETKASTLILSGKLGSGKTVLLANMVDDIYLSFQGENIPLAYFFCRHDDLESLKPRTVIGSLSRQILLSLKYPDDASYLDENLGTLDLDQIRHVLDSAIPNNFRAYVVLDGLGECKEEDMKETLQILLELQDKFRISLVISVRSEAGNSHDSSFHNLACTKRLVIPENNIDIPVFIKQELERCLESGKLTLGDSTIILEIEDALRKGAQGMFLWAALQIQSICMEQTDAGIKQALTDLPRNISDVYSLILRKSKTQETISKERIFELVLAACRPLTTEEMREALSVVPGNSSWNSQNLLNNIYKVLASCGSLLFVDEEELTIRLVHHSVKGFLLAGDPEGCGLTLNHAHQSMGEIIITYLNYNIFGRELSKAKAPQVRADIVTSSVVKAALKPNGYAQKLALKLLRAPNKDPDIGQVLFEQVRYQHYPSLGQFYNYASSRWQEHIWHANFSEHSMRILSAKLFAVVDPKKTDFSGRSPLFHAVKLDLDNVINAILDRCTIPIEESYQSVRDAIEVGSKRSLASLLRPGRLPPDIVAFKDELRLQAVETGNPEILTVLLEVHPVHIELELALVTKMLERAAPKQNVDVVKTLVTLVQPFPFEYSLRVALLQKNTYLFNLLANEPGADIRSPQEGRRQFLLAAVESDDRDMFRAIAVEGLVNLNSIMQHNTDTPLLRAIRLRYLGMVRLMVSMKRVDLNARNVSGETPLILATYVGMLDVVEILMSPPVVDRVDVNAGDQFGDTALTIAIRQNHEDIIRILTQSGKASIKCEKLGGVAVSQRSAEIANIPAQPPNQRPSSLSRPLVEAVLNGDVENVSTLLGLLQAKHEGQDRMHGAFMIAIGKGNAEIVKLFTKSGLVDINGASGHLNTPLMRAIERGRESVVQVLLQDPRIDVNQRSGKSGTTPLSLAVERGNSAIIGLLLQHPNIIVAFPLNI